MHPAGIGTMAYLPVAAALNGPVPRAALDKITLLELV